MMEAVMGAILKFGATLFGHLVFYDFFRDQLKFRVRDRKLRFLILPVMCGSPQAGQFL